MEAMAKHHSHSIEFKRQIAQEFIAGETLHSLAKRRDLSRNLIRIWVKKLEAGAFDEDARAADLLTFFRSRCASGRANSTTRFRVEIKSTTPGASRLNRDGRAYENRGSENIDAQSIGWQITRSASSSSGTSLGQP
jgi:transposase-like protein